MHDIVLCYKQVLKTIWLGGFEMEKSMISKVGQIMLYVNNQDKAVNFWTEKAGFRVIADENNGQGMRWIEMAPSRDAETSIILHNKELVAKMQPELNLVESV